MPGGAAAELAEALQLVERHVGIAEQVQEPVEQHRAVPVRQDEAVAVGPVRGLWVKAQELGEQHGRDVGHPHRHAGMAGFGLLDGVHRERAQRVRHAAQWGRGRRGGGLGRCHGGQSSAKCVTAKHRARGRMPHFGLTGGGSGEGLRSWRPI